MGILPFRQRIDLYINSLRIIKRTAMFCEQPSYSSNYNSYHTMLNAIISLITLQTYIFLVEKKSALWMTQAQQYDVSLTPSKVMINKGEGLKALCNIPGHSILDIINKLEVEWYHNGRQLTDLCNFLDPGTMRHKYGCNVLSPQANNISIELTIQSVQKKDSGNMTCEVFKKVKQNGKWIKDRLLAKNAIDIKLREPITSMSFKFDLSQTETLTLDDDSAPQYIEVNPGLYTPTCMVNGSSPKAEVIIMIGNKTIQGRIVDILKDGATRFVGDAIAYKGNTESTLICRSSVPGLPYKQKERIYTVYTKCMPYKYGPNCVFDCGHCKEGKPCYTKNGTCETGCEPDWKEIFCDRATGCYSSASESKISDQELSKTGLIIISVISTLLGAILLSALVIIIYLKRTRNLQQTAGEHKNNDQTSDKDTRQEHYELLDGREEHHCASVYSTLK